MLRNLSYGGTIVFATWYAAANPDQAEAWRATAHGLILMLSGCGLTWGLYQPDERKRDVDRALRWAVRVTIRRILLLRSAGRCNAIGWARWRRCNREPEHPNLHCHAHTSWRGTVTKLTGWSR